MSRVGIIAEDDSDVDVIRSIIRKIARRSFGIDKFVGHGCGKVRSKCRAWSQNLHQRGCTLLIVVHDLDTANLRTLRQSLAVELTQSPIKRNIIVIPVREIEAWLLADQDAIRKALNLSMPIGKVSNPEAIARPKERLGELIYIRSGHKTRYVNSIHNVKIADASALTNLRRCASFIPLEDFLIAHLR